MDIPSNKNKIVILMMMLLLGTVVFAQIDFDNVMLDKVLPFIISALIFIITTLVLLMKPRNKTKRGCKKRQP